MVYVEYPLFFVVSLHVHRHVHDDDVMTVWTVGENVIPRNIQWEHPRPVEPGVGISGAPGRHVQEPDHPGDGSVGGGSGVHWRGDGAVATG